MLSLILAAAVSIPVAVPRSSPSAKAAGGEARLFATTLRWEAADVATASALKKRISEFSRYETALDPDCYYRPLRDGNCPPHRDPAALERISRLAAELREETGGVFEVATERAGRPARDFGGIAQGFVLEELARAVPGAWYANFSGDVFLTGGIAPPRPLRIVDPVWGTIPYAEVRVERGWMIASGGRALGTELRRASARTRLVVLFAEPGFDGARLDAWATAVAAGGRAMLERLLALKRHRGRWAYLIFEGDAPPFCSPEISCHLSGEDRRIVVDWGGR